MVLHVGRRREGRLPRGALVTREAIAGLLAAIVAYF
jgi:hypothetical protein